MDQSTTLDPGIEAILTHGRPAFPGEVQSPDDAASAAAEFDRKFGEQPRPVRDSRGLLIHIGDCLAAVGLEPVVKAGVIDFLFLGRLHRLSLIDLDRDVEESLRGTGDRAAIDAGLPVG